MRLAWSNFEYCEQSDNYEVPGCKTGASLGCSIESLFARLED